MSKTVKRPTGRPSSGTLGQRRPDLAAQLVNPADARLSCGSKQPVQWRCPVNPYHVWEAPIGNRTRPKKPSGCPFCSGRRPVPGINDLATTHPDLAAQLLHPEQASALKAASNRRVTWRCAAHPEHTWEAVVSQRAREGTGCPYCSGRRRTPVATHSYSPSTDIKTSTMEQALAQVIADLLPGRTIWTNSTTVCPPYEIDIVVPDLRIAIEFNGLFWHSEKMRRTHTYHRDKTRALNQHGYQLIHVWEDDWMHNRDVLVRTLAYKLHALDRLADLEQAGVVSKDRLAADHAPARTLMCSEETPGSVYAFLDRHHLQGRTALTRAFVLRDTSGTVRAVLGLRSAQHNSRMNRAPGVWEIQRYATRGVVPGGFTRLLAHAEHVLLAEDETLTAWVTMSANDISDGAMYRAAGFTVDHEVRPNYTYAGNKTGWRRVSKESFQKKRFKTDPALAYDPTMTETQLAELNRLVRIWDAGKICWIKKIKH